MSSSSTSDTVGYFDQVRPRDSDDTPLLSTPSLDSYPPDSSDDSAPLLSSGNPSIHKKSPSARPARKYTLSFALSLFLAGGLSVLISLHRSWEPIACKRYPSLCKGKMKAFSGLYYDSAGGDMYYPAFASLGHWFDNSQTQPSQPHPIHLLIATADQEWERKLERQSSSLEGAVVEYERRYGIRPPKGFDNWYTFATERNFSMIDEFDSLEKLQTFLAVPSSVLQARSESMRHDTSDFYYDKAFTLQILDKGRTILAEGPMLTRNNRSNDMIALLHGVTEHLPDLNLTINGHDAPWVVLGGDMEEIYMAAAKRGVYINEAIYMNASAGDDTSLDGWAAACPPGSAIRSAERFALRENFWEPPPLHFIEDHMESSNLCDHPESQNLHGFTSWPGPRSQLLYPMFSSSSNNLHSDLLVPPLEQYEREQGDLMAWEDKLSPKVVWRGGNTGADFSVPMERIWSQRSRLVRLSSGPGNLTIYYAPNDTDTFLGNMQTFTAPHSELGKHYFDFEFSGKAIQCGDEASCAEVTSMFDWDTDFMSASTQNSYKYLMDTDGNGWSGRFHRLMSTNSMVLKSTIFPEWYSDRIQPWKHYVPVSMDYSDLWSIMAFFRGNEEGVGAHDDLARQIALDGKHWAENYWRKDDMQVYFYRLLLEYARIMNRDDDNPRSMDYQ